MKCVFCGNEIDYNQDKFIELNGEYSHLDCWVTNMFKKGGFNKEIFGALATAIDYLISAKQLILEATSKCEAYRKDLRNSIDRIENEVSIITRFILDKVLK